MSGFEFAKSVIVSNSEGFDEIINDSLNGHISPSDETNKIVIILEKLVLE